MRRDCRRSWRGFWIARSRPNFSDSLETLAQRTALLGALNSLSQITLKATMPGVPDFYQGTEFWDLSLVDPDNRRPVDFAQRAAVLASVGNAGLGKPRAALAGRPYQAGLDPASAETSDRTCRCVHAWRLSAARGHRPASRPCHRLCAAPWPRRRHHRRHEIIRADCRKAAGPGPARRTYDGAIRIDGYSVEGSRKAGAAELRLSDIFSDLPVAVLKARVKRA